MSASDTPSTTTNHQGNSFDEDITKDVVILDEMAKEIMQDENVIRDLEDDNKDDSW